MRVFPAGIRIRRAIAGALCLYASAMPAVWAAGEVAAAPSAKPVLGAGWLQWSLAMVLVMAALLVFLWLLRRLSGVAAGGREQFKILAGLSLGGRERVVLLQTGRKQLVLGVCPGRIETLCVLEGEERITSEAAAASASGSFAARLQAAMRKEE